MKPQKLIGSLLLIVLISIFNACKPPVYKPMDIAAYNQNTKKWKFDYNLFPLNPNWQYKLVTGIAPWTKNQCPLSDNPTDWKNSRTCTSQDLHFNDGQIGCTDLFSGHGGHMNWFPVTEVGIVNFSDHSSDDDYNFYLKTPDASLYLGSDDPDPMNQYVGLEFDSDEFPDPVDDDYKIWWNDFHKAVDDGDSWWGSGDYHEAQALVKDKLCIVTGMAGIDIGHDATNTWTTEVHPVFGMFILTDEQTSINPNGSVNMLDTWSFFIRNRGDEGYCSSNTEYASRKQLNVLIPEMPFYYAGEQTRYPADTRDGVTIDDGNVHITNWNGVTNDNDPRRERWTEQVINGGVILSFNFDSKSSDGIFVGDIKMNWTVYISFSGAGNLRTAEKYMDESKFKDAFKGLYADNSGFKRKTDFESKNDSLLSLRASKLSKEDIKELNQALAGKTTIPGMPKLEFIAKGKSAKIGAVAAGKDSVDLQQFNAQVQKMKIGDTPWKFDKKERSENHNPSSYAQRKLLKLAYMDAYLRSKHL
ncbi:MAG TPA: hypothetical protein VGO45_14675 [Bacteroidia bacterium]|jgi:hypothetical protein|nr:hypothetical protein [Bacteroidia bacterium]